MVYISSIAQRSEKYLERQAADALNWAEKPIETKYGITKELIDSITPFRRTTVKPAKLSEPDYFISEFEKSTGADFLPNNWDKLSKEDKVDLIVKDRYKKLIAKKVLKQELMPKQVEWQIFIDNSGDLLSLDKGNSSSVIGTNIRSALKDGKQSDISLHNHPVVPDLISEKEFSYIQQKANGVMEHMCVPLSRQDFFTSIQSGISMYVIDAFGHMFHFQPKTEVKNNLITAARLDFNIKEMYNKNKQLKKVPLSQKIKNIFTYIKNPIVEYNKKRFAFEQRYLADKKIIEEDMHIGKYEKLS